MKKIITMMTLLMSLQVAAQLPESPFISYRYKIAPSITYFDSSSEYFLQYNDGKERHTMTLKPNTQKQLVFGLNYHLLSVNFGVTPGFMQVNKDTQKTKQFNLGINISSKKWFHTLNVAHRKGYFMDFNEINGFYSKISTLKLGGSTAFVLNDRFSYRSLAKNTEWQQKSAGSFVANTSFNYTKLNFGDDKDKIYAEMYNIMLAPSYYYNFIIKRNFMISIGLMVGTGFNFSDNDFDPIYELTGHLRLAYNQENFFSFVAINETNTSQKAKDGSFDDVYSTLRIGIGYRFDAPKKVNKVFDDFEHFYKKKLNSVNIFKKKEAETTQQQRKKDVFI
ncbi:DUF4421 family protein [Capnocytophaga sp.]|uniref:DUF4421 family protein n=1 Tax=Capnocytophaga sp. TaxID=44737 RepID=UPI0026DC89B7|nr:DUF4421 family protein [Capnocytophaga sp.]MDO5105270.1 DUF4421 family protein [Capnocytophaga sp.]